MNRAMSIGLSYGALELKRSYQRNFTIGMILAIGLVIVAAASSGLISQKEIVVIYGPPRPPSKVKIDNWLPPVLPPGGDKRQPPQIELPEQFSNEIIVVENDLDTADVSVLTQKQLALLNLSKSWGTDLIDNISFDELSNPASGLNVEKEFNYYEEPPVVIEKVIPKYPEIARRAGIEGEVVISVLIGDDGVVKEAVIEVSSNREARFEEAALAAALRTIWKPALAGNHAVPVWVSYKIEFRLK